MNEQITVADEKGKKIAYRVEAVSIVMNFVLTAFKLIAGLVAHSSAMVSDAVHSASDVFGSFVVIIGVNMSGKEADKEHPYGHERMECLAAIILSAILAVTGVAIGFDGVKKVIAGSEAGLAAPGVLALVAAVTSIVVKEWMYWYTRAAAKKVNSSALMANAWHHRSDAFSSIGSFAGILGARLGFPILDPIAAVAICFFILKAAYDILKDAIDKMMDHSCDDETEQEIRKIVLEQEGVIDIDDLSTRLFGAKIFVDVSIAADRTLTLEEGHVVAERVHDAVEARFPLVKHCMVHVNPSDAKVFGKV